MSDAALKSDDGIAIPKRITRGQIAAVAAIASVASALLGYVAAWSEAKTTKQFDEKAVREKVERHEQILIKNSEREISRELDLNNLRNDIKSFREAIPRIERQLERLESFDRKNRMGMPGAAAVVNPNGTKS